MTYLIGLILSLAAISLTMGIVEVISDWPGGEYEADTAEDLQDLKDQR